jgi:hypothetical protein
MAKGGAQNRRYSTVSSSGNMRTPNTTTARQFHAQVSEPVKLVAPWSEIEASDFLCIISMLQTVLPFVGSLSLFYCVHPCEMLQWFLGICYNENFQS